MTPGCPPHSTTTCPAVAVPASSGPKRSCSGSCSPSTPGRPAQLEAAWRALDSLAVADQLSVGFAQSKGGECHTASYRQVSDTFSVLCRGIDPTPVPSFRGVPDQERVLHLAAARSSVDTEAAAARLDAVSDALIEASVPAAYKSASSSLAVDWTDHETWSRARPVEDLQPANDPDASFGHAKRNAPGAKDYLFFGYYAQVATMVRDEGGAAVPELVRRIAVHAPASTPPPSWPRHSCACPTMGSLSAMSWPTAGTPTACHRPSPLRCGGPGPIW